MNDSPSILQRYSNKRPADSDATTLLPTSDETDDLGQFGILRGNRDRALMLELRKKNGNIKAFGYAWLAEAEYNPSLGINLLIAGHRVRITGRNLNAEIRPQVRLFDGILRHRVTFIQEADEHTLIRAGKGETVVEGIAW